MATHQLSDQEVFAVLKAGDFNDVLCLLEKSQLSDMQNAYAINYILRLLKWRICPENSAIKAVIAKGNIDDILLMLEVAPSDILFLEYENALCKIVRLLRESSQHLSPDKWVMDIVIEKANSWLPIWRLLKFFTHIMTEKQIATAIDKFLELSPCWKILVLLKRFPFIVTKPQFTTAIDMVKEYGDHKTILELMEQYPVSGATQITTIISARLLDPSIETLELLDSLTRRQLIDVIRAYPEKMMQVFKYMLEPPPATITSNIRICDYHTRLFQWIVEETSGENTVDV
jgi:hypothetical protein